MDDDTQDRTRLSPHIGRMMMCYAKGMWKKRMLVRMARRLGSYEYNTTYWLRGSQILMIGVVKRAAEPDRAEAQDLTLPAS